jgi:hypothetical protein
MTFSFTKLPIEIQDLIKSKMDAESFINMYFIEGNTIHASKEDWDNATSDVESVWSDIDEDVEGYDMKSESDDDYIKSESDDE